MGLLLSTRRALINDPIGCLALRFDGVGALVNCGSDATLDNLPSAGIMTVDGWVRFTDRNDAIVSKGQFANRGWTIRGWDLTVELGGVRVDCDFPAANWFDGLWHHFVATYIDATKTGRVAVGAVWQPADVGVGAYVADAVDDFQMGVVPNPYLGDIAWIRVSDNDRFGAATGAVITIPARCPVPAIDGNVTEQWNIDEGSGLVTAASVNSPVNDGAITDATWISAE